MLSAKKYRQCHQGELENTALAMVTGLETKRDYGVEMESFTLEE